MDNLSVTPERNHCFKTNPQVAHLQIGPKTFLGRSFVLWPEIDSDIKMPIRKNHVCQFFMIYQNHLPQFISSPIERDKSSYYLLYCSGKVSKSGRHLEMFLPVLSPTPFASVRFQSWWPCWGLTQIHSKAMGYFKMSRVTQLHLSDSRDYDY